MECIECYGNNNRETPLLKPKDCLDNHEQYICGTCGRCICIAKDEKRGVQRWNFPFKTLEIAKLYLRTADVTTKKACGIYEITSSKNRVSYKIFVDDKALEVYLHNNKDKSCLDGKVQYKKDEYKEFQNTVIKVLDEKEAELYLLEQEKAKK